MADWTIDDEGHHVRPCICCEKLKRRSEFAASRHGVGRKCKQCAGGKRGRPRKTR